MSVINHNTLLAAGSTTTPSFTITASTAGTLLVAAFVSSGGSATSVTDSAGNTWLQATATPAAIPKVAIWYLPGNLNAGGITTINPTWGTNVRVRMIYAEVTLIASSSPLRDQGAVVGASGAATASTTGTSTLAGDFVFTAFSQLATGITVTFPSGYTTGDDGHATVAASLESAWETAASSGTQSAAWSSSNTSAACEGVIATFKPASTAWTAAPTETVTATDAVARVFVGARQNTETATTSDTPNRVQALLRALFEAIGVTDLTNRAGVFKRQDAENAATTDTANRSGVFGRNTPESTTAGDAVARSEQLQRESIDSTTTSDRPNRVQQLLRAIAETVQTLDSAAASVGHGATDWVVSAVESVITSDLVQRALTLGRNTPETTAAADTTARQAGLGRAAQEATGGADAAGRSVSAQRSVDDTATTQDAPGRIHGVIAAVAETLSNSETLDRAASILRTIAEALHVTDLVSAIIGRSYRPSGQGMVLTPLPHAMTLTALSPAEMTLPAQPFALTLTPRS